MPSWSNPCSSVRSICLELVSSRIALSISADPIISSPHALATGRPAAPHGLPTGEHDVRCHVPHASPPPLRLTSRPLPRFLLPFVRRATARAPLPFSQRNAASHW